MRVVASAMAKGHVENPGKGLGQQGLAAAGGTHEQDIALFKLHVIGHVAREEHALVVVVHRHGEYLLGLFLTYDEILELGLEFRGGEQAPLLDILADALLGDDFIAQGHALVADIHIGARDEPLDFVLILAAKGTIQVRGGTPFPIRHTCYSLFSLPWSLLEARISSIMPYSLASAALKNLSLSASRATFLTSLPVCWAIMPLMISLVRRISLA